MFKFLRIRNFESWEEGEFEFVPGLNVIIGLSDAGKSSFMRAINWVVNNKPAGDDFRSHWGGNVWVDLDLEEGFLICRGKTKSDNLYTLTDSDGGEEEFRAFGQGVPEKIEKLINFSDLNQQDQMDGPFLVASSGGEVARYLNQVADLEDIDFSLYGAAREVRVTERELKSKEDNLKSLEGSLKEFDWLEEAEGKIVVLEELSREVVGLERKYSDLNSLYKDVRVKEQELEREKEILGARSEVDTLLEKVSELQEMVSKYNDLNFIVEQIEEMQEEKKVCAEVLEAAPTIGQLLELIEELEREEEKCADLDALYKSIRRTRLDLDLEREELRKLEEEFHELMPDVCPLCGRGKEEIVMRRRT